MTDLDPSQRPDDPLAEIEAGASGPASRLHDSRPLPAATFRGDLRRHLVAAVPARGARHPGAPALIAAYGLSGLVLLVVATAGVAGIGPFAS